MKKYLLPFLIWMLTVPAIAQETSIDELSSILTETSLNTNNILESQYYLMKGKNAVYLKQWDEALKLMDQAVKLDPTNREALVIGGDILYSQGKKKDALKYYKRGLSAGVEEPALLYKIGVTSLEMGDNKEAIEYFNRALNLSDKFAEAYVGRGDAKMKLEFYEAAIQDFSYALELNPGLSEAYIGKGYSYTQQGNYYNGLQELTKALQLNPSSGIAYYYRGLTHIKSFNEKKACDDFTKAAELGIEDAKKQLKKTCKGR